MSNDTQNASARLASDEFRVPQIQGVPSGQGVGWVPLETKQVSAVTAADNGTIWYVSDNSVFCRQIDGTVVKKIDIPITNPYVPISYIAVAPNGDVFICGSYSHMQICKSGSTTFVPVTYPYIQNAIYCRDMMYSSTSDLWTGYTHEDGIQVRRAGTSTWDTAGYTSTVGNMHFISENKSTKDIWVCEENGKVKVLRGGVGTNWIDTGLPIKRNFGIYVNPKNSDVWVFYVPDSTGNVTVLRNGSFSNVDTILIPKVTFINICGDPLTGDVYATKAESEIHVFKNGVLLNNSQMYTPVTSSTDIVVTQDSKLIVRGNTGFVISGSNVTSNYTISAGN